MSHLGEGTAGSSHSSPAGSSPPIERQRGRLSPEEAYSTATTMERGSAAASNLEGGRRGGRDGEVGGGEELGHHLREQQHSAACSPHLPAYPDCHCPFGASSVCQPLLIYGEGSICTTEQQEEEDNHQVYNPPIEEGEERTGLGGSEEGSQFDPASPLSIAGAAMGEVASRFSNRQKSIGLTFFLTFLLLTGCVALFDSLLDSRDDEEEARRENGESLDEWTNSDAKQYLDQFGYIGEPSALEADQVGTPGHLLGARPQHRTAEQLLEDFSLESLKSAIRRFQEFAGLPATGELDNRTKKKMKQPRCGLQDVLMLRGRGESSAVFKWRKRHLTYAVESFSGDLPHYMQKKAVQMAFDTWAKHIPLDFSEVSSHQQPDIRVRFARRSHGDPWPFDGRGGVLAHATFPSDGQLHFDDDEQWAFMDAAKIASYRYTDLFWVALHEIGHVLGLSHSKVETSIMAPFYRDADDIVDWRGNYKSPELTSDDIRAAHEIYGKRSVTGSGRSGNGGQGQQRHRQQGGPKSNREGGVYDDSQGGFLNRLGKIFTGESDDNGETAAEEGEEGQRPVGHWRNNQRNGGEQSRHRTSDWGTRGGGGSRVNDNEDAEEQEDEGMFGGLFTSAGTREGIPTIFCLLTGLLMALLSLEFFGI